MEESFETSKHSQLMKKSLNLQSHQEQQLKRKQTLDFLRKKIEEHSNASTQRNAIKPSSVIQYGESRFMRRPPQPESLLGNYLSVERYKSRQEEKIFEKKVIESQAKTNLPLRQSNSLATLNEATKARDKKRIE